jgi:hypothetical protein
MSHYRPDDQGLIAGRANDFSSNLCTHPDWLWGPPSLLHNGYRQSLTGSKARPGRDADHSSPSSAEVKMSRNYATLPLGVCKASSGTALLYVSIHAQRQDITAVFKVSNGDRRFATSVQKREQQCDNIDWIHLAQDRRMTLTNFRHPTEFSIP